MSPFFRHLENVSVKRNISYGVVEFHQIPIVLLPIVSSFASRPEKVDAKYFILLNVKYERWIQKLTIIVKITVADCF